MVEIFDQITEQMLSPEMHRSHHGPNIALAVLLSGVHKDPEELEGLINNWDGNISEFLDVTIGDRKSWIQSKTIKRSTDSNLDEQIGRTDGYYDDLTGVNAVERDGPMDKERLELISRVRAFLTLWLLESKDSDNDNWIQIGSLRDDVCRSCVIGNHCTRISDGSSVDSEIAERLAESFEIGNIEYEMINTNILEYRYGLVHRGKSVKVRLSDFRKFLLVRAIYYRDLKKDIFVRRLEEEEKLRSRGYELDEDGIYKVPQLEDQNTDYIIKQTLKDLKSLQSNFFLKGFDVEIPPEIEARIYENLQTNSNK